MRAVSPRRARPRHLQPHVSAAAPGGRGAHHRRSARRRADGDVPEGAQRRRAPHSHLLAVRKLSCRDDSRPHCILIACFAAGLLVAGRLRDATEAGAQSPGAARPASQRAGTCRRRRQPPRLQPHRRADDPGRRQHLVAAGRPASARRTTPSSASSATRTTSSDRGAASRTASAPASSSAATATSSPTITWSPASRDGCASSSSTSPSRSPTSARCRRRSIGVDPATDLALLKIDARNLPTMPWGDSSKLKVAEWVLAIGNPYQLNQTVTLGIVSAVGRTNLGISTYEDFIQTDAAINPGNSGGALVNAPRRAGRHQHGHLQPERRLPGHRLRRVEQPRAAGRQRPAAVRRGAARLDRPAAESGRDLTTQNAAELELPDTHGALIYEMSARLVGLSSRPATGRRHRHLQRHRRSTTRDSSRV